MLKKLLFLILLLGSVAGCSRQVDPVALTARAGETTPIPAATRDRDLSRSNSKRPCPTCPPPPTPTATPAIGGRSKPIPFGETFQLVADEAKVFTLTLVESVRGEEAWQRILEANQFNEPPPEGMEYLLIYAQVDYVRGPANQVLQLDEWDFRIVSQGQVRKPLSVVEPEPVFELELFPNASSGGWMVWTVVLDDDAPLLAYGLDYKGRDGTFFVATAGE